MSVALKKILPQALAPAMAPDLRRMIIEASPGDDRATRLRSTAQDLLSAVGSARRVSVIPAGGGNVAWLVANLAYALAEMRPSVCLVEANLHMPRLGSVFDLPPTTPGLTDVLMGNVKIDMAKYEINERLSIVPGGVCYDDVVRLVASSALDHALTSLSDSLILILCPTATDHLDYSFISRFCEGGLVIARKDKCRMADAMKVRSQLDKLGLPLLYALLVGGEK